MSRRHARQVLLAEVGEAGQRRITESAWAVRARGLAGLVEARYVAGAGFGRIVAPDDEVARAAKDVDATLVVEVAREGEDADARTELEDPAWIAELSPSARDVGLGAYRALSAIREALAKGGA
jgi:hypothetical protein